MTTEPTHNQASPSIRRQLGRENMEIIEEKLLPMRTLLLCAKEFGGGEGCIFNNMERVIVDEIIKQATCCENEYLVDVYSTINMLQEIPYVSGTLDNQNLLLSNIKKNLEIFNPRLIIDTPKFDIIEFLNSLSIYEDSINLLLENHDYKIDFSKEKNALSLSIFPHNGLLTKLMKIPWINHDNINLKLLDNILYFAKDEMLDEIFGRIRDDGIVLDMNIPRFNNGYSIVDYCINRRGLVNMKTLRKYGGVVKLKNMGDLNSKYDSMKLGINKLIGPSQAEKVNAIVMKKQKVEFTKHLVLAKEFCPESIFSDLPYEILKIISEDWGKLREGVLENMFRSLCLAIGLVVKEDDKITLLKDLLVDMKERNFDPNFIPVDVLRPLFFILLFMEDLKEVLIKLCELWKINFDVEAFSKIDLNVYIESECLETLAELKKRKLILKGVKSIYTERMLVSMCGLLAMYRVIDLDLVEKDFRFKNGDSLIDRCIREKYTMEAVDMARSGVKLNERTYNLVRSIPDVKEAQILLSLLINLDTDNE